MSIKINNQKYMYIYIYAHTYGDKGRRARGAIARDGNGVG